MARDVPPQFSALIFLLRTGNVAEGLGGSSGLCLCPLVGERYPEGHSRGGLAQTEPKLNDSK